MQSPAKASLLIFFSAFFLSGAESYQKPSQAILDILNSPTTPVLFISPARTHAIQGRPVRYPPIAELAQPMLRLAGLRINPKTNGLHNVTFHSSLALRKLPEGTETKIALPPNPKLNLGAWSPDGNHFAFTNTTPKGIELWIADTATGKTRQLQAVQVNGVMSGISPRRSGRSDIQWTPDSKALLVELVRANRGAPPTAPETPPGPHVQESLGNAAPVVTHEDMLENPHDEDLFEYYATSQLAVVDPVTGKTTPIGKPGIIEAVHNSPDGSIYW